MDSEPILVYSALLDAKGQILGFADYDDMVHNPFMGTYHFEGLSSDVSEMQAIWYDLFSEKFFFSTVSFGQEKVLFNNKDSYIDICFQLGGLLVIWVITPNKSILIVPSIKEVPDEYNSINNDEWIKLKEEKQSQFNLNREQTKTKIALLYAYNRMLFSQFCYRYIVQFQHWEGISGEWSICRGNEILPQLFLFHENLFDGTHDKLNDGGLFNYHQAGKPKKLALKWHEQKNEFAAYFWFHDEEIKAVFERIYGPHPETKTDFIIRVDSQQDKYEVSMYRYGMKEPYIMPEEAYELIVFKNKFEAFRSENYDQPRGAWIW